jgi:hypothetical protein
VVLGRAEAEVALEYTYADFSLGNEHQNLGIFCNRIVIDYLYYYNSSKATETGLTSPFPVSQGKAMQLPLSRWQSRSLGESWCQGASPGEDAGC